MADNSTVTVNGSQTGRFSIDWNLNEELEGAVISVFVAIELVLSLATNVFICVHSLSHPTSLKKSSTIFLLNLALSNLIITVFYMPFAVIASGAEEWIFGANDEVRNITCQTTAFIFSLMVATSIHTLAAISLDRCLSIVRPFFHKRVMKPMVALSIVIFIWIFAVALNVVPFAGLGEYGWSGAVGACLPIWVGHVDYVIYLSVESIIPFGIITVTTTWTYICTKLFLKRDYQRRSQTLDQRTLEREKSVYTIRVRNLFGIFGALVFFNLLTLSPYIIASIAGFIVGFENIPSQVYAAVFVQFLLINVTNSVIQSYFRKELKDTIVKYCMKVSSVLCKMRSLAQASREAMPNEEISSAAVLTLSTEQLLKGTVALQVDVETSGIPNSTVQDSAHPQDIL